MIYMNNAATSFPKPPCVAEAVKDAILHEPGDFKRGGSKTDTFAAVRQELAELMEIKDSSQLALLPNASYALNQGILGFPLNEGDSILSTKAEHNSVLRPLYKLKQQGINVILLDTDRCGRISPENWSAALKKYKPALAVFTHASNVTGAVNDAAELCKAAKAAGARVLVDASQSLGFTAVKPESWGADMLAFTGHKYLLGPQGTGGLWVSPDINLCPVVVGGTGVKSDMDEMPREMPLHLEAGTGNEPSFSGLLAALKWQKKNPVDKADIIKRTEKLSRGLKTLGADVIEVTGDRTAVISFTVPGLSCEEAGYLLREGGDIVCRTGLHCAPKIFSCLGIKESIRLSLSRFTTDEEVNEVLEAVEAIIP